MHILHICTDFAYTEVYPNLVRALNKRGLTQSIYMPIRNPDHAGWRQEDLPNTNYFYDYVLRPIMKLVYPYKINATYKSIIEKIDFSQIDINHCHFQYTDGGLALRLKKEKGVPYIVTIRNTDVNLYHKYFHYLRPKGIEILKEAEAVIFISPSYKVNAFKNIFPKKYHQALESKSFVQPNGISDFWHENIDNTIKNKTIATKLKSGVPIKFLSVGLIDKNKNHLFAVKLIKKLAETIPCELTIIGTPDDAFEALQKEMVQNPTLIKHVPYIEEKEKLLPYYRASDIFIMPSQLETFGLVYVEALSQGLPVLYTKTQGFDGNYPEGTVGYGLDIRDFSKSPKIQSLLHKIFSGKMSRKVIINSIPKY
jgi:L-malate glycosyltransferase